MTTFQIILAGVILLYVIIMFAISIWAQRQVNSSEDYLVAGRRLPLSLAWATLLATWFGAGTVLTQSDEVRENGLQQAALDPLGAGLCLIIAGLFFAVPLWKMGLLTLSDFFRRRFGPKAEFLSACIMVPSYFGWIAAQFVALAEVLEHLFHIPKDVGILLVAVIGMSYTLMGGMWSVTLTDALQITLVLLGLVVLGITVLVQIGGMNEIVNQTKPELRQWIPPGLGDAFAVWLGTLCIGIFGNIPGQDLMQRVFAAKSAKTARWACLIAGGLYLIFGLIPVMLGLAGGVLMPDEEGKIIPALAEAFLHPVPFTIFLLALISAILSTIDSAILSPASVLSQNVFPRINVWNISSLTLNRLAVLLVTIASVGLAYAGESAYELLEGAYELTLVGLFIPLAMGIYWKRGGEWAAIASMIVGVSIWMTHFVLDHELLLLPFPLHRAIGATLASLAIYTILSLILSEKEVTHAT